MVSSRFTSFVFVLGFILHQSAADINQVTKKMDVAARKGFTVEGGSPSAVRKDILDVVPTPQEASNRKAGGRKMMRRRFLMRQMVKRKDTMIYVEASKISGATDSNIVKCTKRKTNLSTECDMEVKNVNYHHLKRDDLSSFVALNADYHPPKSHPPKNN